MFLFALNARIEQDTGIYHGFLLFANATATSKADQPETQVFAGFSNKIWYVYGYFGHENLARFFPNPSSWAVPIRKKKSAPNLWLYLSNSHSEPPRTIRWVQPTDLQEVPSLSHLHCEILVGNIGSLVLSLGTILKFPTLDVKRAFESFCGLWLWLFVVVVVVVYKFDIFFAKESLPTFPATSSYQEN